MSATLTSGLTPSKAVLASGATVLAQEVGTSPAVALNATFATGSIDDPEDRPGVAYLVRRVIDRGTERRSARDIAQALDDRGVSLRVSVSRHTFSLSCNCLIEDFDDVLALVVDIARRPVFSEDEIEKRRVEAITSIRQDEDNPSEHAIDVLVEMLYGPRHPYGRRHKGTVASQEAIGRQDLLKFHARHLVPSALCLAIVGDVPAGRALERAARELDGWSGPPAGVRSVPPPPPRRSRELRAVSMPGKAQADIGYGFTTITRLDPRYYAYWMMNNILGQFGLGGRLADNIRERQGMAYYAYSTLEARAGEGPLIVRAGVDPANVGRAIEAIDAEVRALGEAGPTAGEMEDTRESIIGSIPRMLETNESIADFLQTVQQYDLGLDFDRALPGLLRTVTLDDVRDAAREVLQPGRAAIVVAGPAA